MSLELLPNTTVPVELDRGSKNISNRGELMMVNNSAGITHNGTKAWKKDVLINGTTDLFLNPLSVNRWVSFYSPEQLRNLYFTQGQISTEF